jgi:hypothetical protein
MVRVPAVCDRCGAFFPSPIEADNSTNITFSNVAVGPCPRCGGTGHVPDGTYNFVGRTIEFLSGPGRSRTDLERLASILRTARDRGATVEDIKGEVRREVPELSSIADLLPKTRSELYAFIAILLTVLTLLLGEIKKGNEPHIEVHQVFNQITQVVGSPPRQVQHPPEPARSKTGRNERCPCGSGKKYKKCHGA